MNVEKEAHNLLDFAWGMGDTKKLTEKEQYQLADNLLTMTLNIIGTMLPKTEIWHTGCTELNVWMAGKGEEMDRACHFDKKMTRKDKEQLLDIMERPKGKRK